MMTMCLSLSLYVCVFAYVHRDHCVSFRQVREAFLGDDRTVVAKGRGKPRLLPQEKDVKYTHIHCVSTYNAMALEGGTYEPV